MRLQQTFAFCKIAFANEAAFEPSLSGYKPPQGINVNRPADAAIVLSKPAHFLLRTWSVQSSAPPSPAPFGASKPSSEELFVGTMRLSRCSMETPKWSISEFDLGCVKTQMLNLRVELPPRFCRRGNPSHWEVLLA